MNESLAGTKSSTSPQKSVSGVSKWDGAEQSFIGTSEFASKKSA